jgi:hypothetical protein
MDKTKLLNPRTWFTTELDAKTETSLTPVNDNMAITDERGRDAEVVSGTFVPTIDVTGNSASALALAQAQKQTERLRKKVEAFDEDRQSPAEWIIVKLFTGMAYLMPTITAYVVGMAIGDAFAGPLKWSDNWSVYGHVISLFFEFWVVVIMRLIA